MWKHNHKNDFTFDVRILIFWKWIALHFQDFLVETPAGKLKMT